MDESTTTPQTVPAQTPSLLDAALHYAARGWHVFPCHTPLHSPAEITFGTTTTRCSCRKTSCPDIGKHPRSQHGLSDATRDEATIRRWWTMWPKANIAIRTGALSGLVALDVDRHKGGAESLDDLERSYHPLPTTVQALTGKGDHYLFAHPGTPIKNSVATLGAGLDIRGDGGYIIAPPSLHANGTCYVWDLAHEPDDTLLAPMPAWLLALCQESTTRTGPSASEPIPDGQRGDTLFKLGCSMRARGFSHAAILAALEAINVEQCLPPVPAPRLQAIAARCATYEVGQSRDLHQRRNGFPPGPEPGDPATCPALPTSAKVDETRAKEASIFLDDYIAFSQKWAPRAYQGFHEAAALFALSTTAARRVHIEFGPQGVYTSLYMALASRTSLFTKTTTVDIGLALLRAAGLFSLLADDDATPQAFLRSLTLYIPPDYAELPPETQEGIKNRLAFAGQKGWFYEEWGQHLHAMMQKEGQMAHFRGIMKRLDDHKEEYSYATIGRGRDVLYKPYVTLLANVTPADLKPFLRAQSPLWRDGYIARFAFITPPKDANGTTAPFPEGPMVLPRALITSLASWHKRLGIPRVTLEPILDAKEKATGRFRPVFVQPHRETTYRLSPEVRKAFYAYDEALRTLMAHSKQDELDGSYARFPMKALRITGLLASLHDDSTRYTIQAPQWYRGQQIAERWRQALHELIAQITDDDPVSPESKGEQRVLTVLRKHGAFSPMEIHRWTKLAHTDIMRYLAGLQQAGAVEELDTGRTKKYRLVSPPLPTEENES